MLFIRLRTVVNLQLGHGKFRIFFSNALEFHLETDEIISFVRYRGVIIIVIIVSLVASRFSIFFSL